MNHSGNDSSTAWKVPASRSNGPVGIMDTVLRDGHQSLLATRMKTADMLPILEKMDQVGYWSAEVWGGATFDSCLRFLKEDPWERLRLIRRHMPNTRLQMLLRGQNLVGYTHYADDLVDRFVAQAANVGIDVFRIFDALNDVRNMRRSIEAVLKAGKIAEGAISYTISPFHTVEHYLELGTELANLGCQVLCIKDMAGLLTPSAAYELVKGLKDNVGLPVHVHSHSTSGMAEGAYMKAVEAGADIIDTAISSMAGGTSQPPTESLVAMLDQTPHSTGLRMDLLTEIADYFREVRKKYAQFESSYNSVDPRVLRYQIPGGMISNLANQLREQDALDRMEEVLEEVPRVREEMGYPPLVTPTSQIVGTQATLNIVLGERYKVFTRESSAVLLGKYGKTIADKETTLVEKASQQQNEEPISVRPADLLEPAWERVQEEARACGGRTDEDTLSYAMFPQVAKTFFAERDRQGPSPEVAAALLAAVVHHLDEQARSTTNSISGHQGGGAAISPWKWAGRLQNLRR